MRRNRLVFYLLWILSLVGISFYGGVVSYCIFCALTLLPVILYGYLLCVFFRFTVYQELGSKTVVCRTPVEYYFTLQNETQFVFARLKVVFFEFGADYGSLKSEEEYELMPKSGRRVATNIVCRYRGEYAIGVKKVILTDFLGLFNLVYRNREPLKVDVYPAIEYPTEHFQAEQKLCANTATKAVPEQRDVLVRPYREGDPLRSINWKATAKSNRLMTAYQTAEENSSIHILVDTKRCGKEPEEYLPREDELLTRLITMVLYYAGQNIRVEVSFRSRGDVVRKVIGSMQDFEEFYRSVVTVLFAPEVDIEALYTDMLRDGRANESDTIVLRSVNPAGEVDR